MTRRFADTDVAVMAGQTVAGICARVVKYRISKIGGVMANGTILVVGVCRYVIQQFANANPVVVA